MNGKIMRGAVGEGGERSERQLLRGVGAWLGAVRAADAVQVCALRPPAVADSCPACAGQSCQRMGFPDVLGEETPKADRQIQTGKRFLNALGPAGDIRSPRRRQASSRNSLPALNAAAVVQVSQLVQRILYKRNVADAGRLPALPSSFASFPFPLPLSSCP